MKHREPQERLHIHVVRLELQRLPKKHQHIGCACGDQRTGLGIAPSRAMQQHAHVKPKALAHGLSRRGRSDEFVPGESTCVEPRPLDEVRLFAVVSDQDDAEPTHGCEVQRPKW